MATYYVDLDLTGTGGDGSSGNPWHADTFIAQCNGLKPGGTVFMIRGTYTGTADLTVIASVPPAVLTLTNWGSNPWVFDTSGDMTVCHGSIVEHAFLRADIINCNYPVFKSCHIVGNTDITATNGNTFFYGCTLVAPNIGAPGMTWPLRMTFESCIVSGTVLGDIVSDYCVFTTALPSGTNTNYQINWTPPTWYFSPGQRYFYLPDYVTGITVPPNPGATPYTGYEKSMWGSARTGIGALYFPGTTYYVDLESSEGNGQGTEASPWGRLQFESYFDECFAGSDIMKLKGTATMTADFQINVTGPGGVIVENWESAPWRVNCTNAQITLGSVKNGIINCSSLFNNYNTTVIDCIIYAPTVNSVVTAYFKGCTIVTPNLTGSETDNNYYNDCIIDSPAISDFLNTTTDRCVFTIAVLPLGTHTNYQVNWTPPTWPAWNDIVVPDFNDTVLAVGITTPPQPGTPPYTDYPNGLWGSTRNGIGAMIFTGTAETYYADLDLHDAGGSGTAGDPWHALTFAEKANGQLGAGSTIKVKGSYENTDDTITVSGLSFTAIIIENWVAAPWRLSTLDFYVTNGSVLKNGIINVPAGTFYYSRATIDDCYISASAISAWDDTNYFTHCTLITPALDSGNGEDGTFTSEFSDCIILAPSITYFDDVTAYNCCFTLDILPTMVAAVDCHIEWAAPSMPAWDADRSAFASYLISTTIPTPPQPGIATATVGLWDSVRNGIGALWFQVAPVGTRYIAKVTAHGWTKDNIYEYDGVQWVETVAIEGLCVFVEELSDIYIFHNGAWVENDVPWLDPVIMVFDNTAALPGAPANGDRYIALVTANGWSISYVYEWNTNNWLETVPTAGMFIYNKDTSEAMFYTGAAWVVFTPLTAHAIGGVLHTASSVTDIKTKVSGPDFLITSQASEFTGLTVKAAPVRADVVIIEDSADTNKKKSAEVGDLVPWLYGTGAPPATTGLVDGTLYIKYTP